MSRINKQTKSYHKLYYEANKERREQYRLENKEQHKAYNKEYNKEYTKSDKYKQDRNEYQRKMYNNDSQYKLSKSIRSLINQSFKTYTKGQRTEEILGCMFKEFKQHLESQFEPWMKWNNKGGIPDHKNTNWDIDHIIPISSAQSLDEVIKLNHYTNLRPLCSYYNRYIKRNRAPSD